jgi:hypothetical protein
VASNAIPATESETNPNTPAKPRLTDGKGMRIPTVRAPKGEAAHAALSAMENLHPSENAKPVRGASVQKNRKGADPKPAAKTKSNADPAPKPSFKKADKTPAERKAPRVPGTISPHPEQAKGDMVPVDVSIRREDLDKFRATLAKGTTFGSTVRQWWADQPSKNVPQALPAGGMTRRTIYLTKDDVKSMTAFEREGDHRVSAFIHARLLAANAK